ncbi:MAG: hypothetical protein GX299_08675 [Epulopiscium sp.]|jgi:cell division protein FtsW (lipid II flippase)|nr:hypothetical protein [Candidatus Epulonipiscium sp.]
MNNQIETILSNMTAETLLIGTILSIVLGVILIFAGFFLKYKKKEQSWWVILVLLGVVTIISKVVQITYY